MVELGPELCRHVAQHGRVVVDTADALHEAGDLIQAGLESARARGLKVIPICPFFAAYIRKHPEEQDLLDSAWRIKFGLDPR